MSYFKVGMRVVAVTDYPEDSYNKRINCGDFGTITGSIDHLIEVKFDGKGSEAIYPWRVEAVTEEPKQMKPTDKITVEITLAELAVSYMVFSKMKAGAADNLYNTAKQMLDPEATIRDATFRKVLASDIIDKCNNPDDVFELMFPEPPKKSKEQIKIKQLQETIDKAARELKELREMGEKK